MRKERKRAEAIEWGIRNAECGKKGRGQRRLNGEFGMRNAERKKEDRDD
jgi:hypothetical protein